MLSILKSNLPLEYKNFWYHIAVKLQKQINGIVEVGIETITNQIIIKIFIVKFNFRLSFSFPYYLKDNEILQYILNEIQLKLYEEVFKKRRITMELEIEDKLEEKYKHLKINVNYIDLRTYQINVKIKVENQEYKKEIIYIWDAHYTRDVNIGTICNQIDNFILGLYRKGSKYYD